MADYQKIEAVVKNLGSAMSWGKTEEGDEYWRWIYHRLEEYASAAKVGRDFKLVDPRLPLPTPRNALQSNPYADMRPELLIAASSGLMACMAWDSTTEGYAFWNIVYNRLNVHHARSLRANSEAAKAQAPQYVVAAPASPLTRDKQLLLVIEDERRQHGDARVSQPAQTTVNVRGAVNGNGEAIPTVRAGLPGSAD